MAANKMRTETDVITVGSCELFLNEFNGTAPAITDKASLMALCEEENRLGHTKGGCTITYSKETNTLSSDDGKLRKTVLKSDELKVKLGLFGWNGDSLTKLEGTASSVDDKANGLRCTKIGGTSNDDGKEYLAVLYHKDNQDGDCWWLFVGKNTGGLEFAYSTDDGVKPEPEFTASAIDPDGHLCYFYEEIETAENAG